MGYVTLILEAKIYAGFRRAESPGLLSNRLFTLVKDCVDRAVSRRVAGFDEGFEHFGCAPTGPLLIDSTYRALADHHLDGRYVCSLFRSRQMLPSDPAKLEQRPGRRLDGDRGLGDRDHPAIGDEQGGAGEVDPAHTGGTR